MNKLTRIVIVGAGHVGSTCAYALLLRGLSSEVVLITANQEHAIGEAMDLNHGLLFTNQTRVWAGDYSDIAGADIVLLAAGSNTRPGETRLDLLQRNAEIFKSIVPQVAQYTRDAILIVVSNPVDVLTHLTWQLSGLPARQVIGSGTILDTARFRYFLSEHFNIRPQSIHGYVIGEHGDSQVPVWSLTNIAGIRLDEYGRLNNLSLSPQAREAIASSTRRAAYEVVQRKGATYFAVSAAVVQIIEAIVRNENNVQTISNPVMGMYGLDQVSLSLPSIVNRHGIAGTLELPLRDEEMEALHRSARVISSAIRSVESMAVQPVEWPQSIGTQAAWADLA